MGGNSSKEIRNRIQSSNYHYYQAFELKNKEKWDEALSHFHKALHGYESLSLSFDRDKLSGRGYVDKTEEIKGEIQAICNRSEKQNHYHLSQSKSVVIDSSRSFNKCSRMKITEGEIGHTYENLFSKYMDNRVTKVDINDAFIQKFHQIRLFLRFCEFLVKTCPNLEKITLTTRLHVDDEERQKSSFSEITSSLSRRQIVLSILYSNTIHDREIRLNNGWIFSIDWGLDFYQPPGEKGFYIGNLDMSLRKCKRSTVTILHESSL
uniref:Putative LOC100119093 [Nasonia vitripennis] n=1 Tax=Lepeophtheirus salmonis TaxID=72036 RepID=A0A0K2UBA1_LEPSM